MNSRVGTLDKGTIEMLEDQAASLANKVIIGVNHSPRQNFKVEGEQLLYVDIVHDVHGCLNSEWTTTVTLVTTNRSWTTRAYIPNEGEVTIRPKIFLRG
jgi:hypothetical protein